MPILWQAGALRMRASRYACWARIAADRLLPRAAVRPGHGLAGLLSQPQALPGPGPLLVGAWYRPARPRSAAMAGVGRCDGRLARGDACPADGVASASSAQRREGK